MTKRWLVRFAALATLGMSLGCQGFCNRHYPCPQQTCAPCCAPCGTYTSAPPPPAPVVAAPAFNRPGAMNCTCTPAP